MGIYSSAEKVNAKKDNIKENQIIQHESDDLTNSLSHRVTWGLLYSDIENFKNKPIKIKDQESAGLLWP